VLVTKYRRKCFSKKILERPEEISKDICSKWDTNLKEFGAEEDHCHLLISCHPAMQLSKFVHNLKTVTGRRIRKEYESDLKKYYWKAVLWTRAYCIISAAGAPLETLKAYIENQGKKEPSPKGVQFIPT